MAFEKIDAWHSSSHAEPRDFLGETFSYLTVKQAWWFLEAHEMKAISFFLIKNVKGEEYVNWKYAK